MYVKAGQIVYIISDMNHIQHDVYEEEILYRIDISKEFGKSSPTDWVVFAAKYRYQCDANSNWPMWAYETMSGRSRTEWGTISKDINKTNVFTTLEAAITEAKKQATEWTKYWLKSIQDHIKEMKAKIAKYEEQANRIGTDYNKVVEDCTVIRGSK